MLDLIRKAIGRKKDEPTEEEDPGVRSRIAACVLLLEAAHADFELREEEIDHVIDTLRAQFGLSPEYAEELVELAQKEREQAIDLWQFTTAVNDHFSRDEKLQVMEAVWRVIHSDGVLEKHEDHYARRLATLLRLDHKDLIEAKLKTIGEQ